MASFPIPAPTPVSLQGDVTANWEQFREAWKYYSIATGLAARMVAGDAAAQASSKIVAAATLCSVMGGDCLKVMNSLPTISDADKKDPDIIITRLTAHFVPQRHVLFERFKFNTANQGPGEPVDAYVLRIRQLAESCELDPLKESLLRDRLVLGTTDGASRTGSFVNARSPT